MKHGTSAISGGRETRHGPCENHTAPGNKVSFLITLTSSYRDIATAEVQQQEGKQGRR